MTRESTDIWPYPGSRWWKFDFHTHTPASLDWRSGDESSSNVTPQDWLHTFMKAEIDCVAVTDHNSGCWIDKLKTAYGELESTSAKGFRPLTIFPGVEISANDQTWMGNLRAVSAFVAHCRNLG